jgi:hypothetical protein
MNIGHDRAGSCGVGPVMGDRKPYPSDVTDAQCALLGPMRRVVALALPGLASLLLYGHFVFTADFNKGTPTFRREGYYVLPSGGELTVAAVPGALSRSCRLPRCSPCSWTSRRNRRLPSRTPKVA